MTGGGLASAGEVSTFNEQGHGWFDDVPVAATVRAARESTLVVAATLDAASGRSRGAGTPVGMLAFGGNNTAGPIDRAAAVRAKGGTGHGDFESETFVLADLRNGTLDDVAQTLQAAGLGADRGGNPNAIPHVIAFDTTQITHPENRSRPDDRSPQLSESGHPPAIAFDCKAGGNTGFAVGESAGALRGDGHGGGHAAVMAFSCKDDGGVAAIGQSPTLRAQNEIDGNANGGGQVAIFKPSHFTRDKDGAPSGVSPPLGAEPDKGDQDPVLMDGAAVRRLTPVECERLQAIPDNWTNVTFRGKPMADGPRYRMIGNSMCVLDVRWILTRIEQFEEATKR